MSSEDAEDQEKSLEAFKKCGNVAMCLSLAFKLKFKAEDVEKLKVELVDLLAGMHRHKEAGDLLCQTIKYEVSQAVDFYTKGNAFMQAIREASKEPDHDN